jgi:hypothetical protein
MTRSEYDDGPALPMRTAYPPWTALGVPVADGVDDDDGVAVPAGPAAELPQPATATPKVTPSAASPALRTSGRQVVDLRSPRIDGGL